MTRDITLCTACTEKATCIATVKDGRNETKHRYCAACGRFMVSRIPRLTPGAEVSLAPIQEAA
jgi:transcription elongation factor Elf1